MRVLLIATLKELADMCEAEECVIPPLKSMFRSYEKTWVRSEASRGDFSMLLDIARGALFFHEVSKLAPVVKLTRLKCTFYSKPLRILCFATSDRTTFNACKCQCQTVWYP